MKIIVSEKLDLKQEAIVLGLFENEKETSVYASELSTELKEAEKKKLFSGKFGELYSTRIKEQRILCLGLGKKEELEIEKVRKLLGKAVKAVKSWQIESFSTDLLVKILAGRELDEELLGRAVAEASILANYNFTKYLAKDKQEKKKSLKSIGVQWDKEEANFGKGLKVGRIIAENANYVKDLVNEPANVVNSLYLEKEARKVAEQGKIKLKVLDEAELRKGGLKALLGVNAGSKNPPKLIILEYNEEMGAPIAFVGKGLTFDSGGYNLKPTKYIEEMKTDMAGAAAVLGVIRAAAELGVKKHLLGVMAVCENMVDSAAQRPGDIVKAYNGKTIEIGNTDAEGRLVLADALAYTEDKYNPKIMIDLATLTGACVYALGYYAAGLMGKDAELIADLKKAGDQSGDRVWELPFYEEFQDWMDGSITDLNNCATKGKGYEASSIMAGVFLGKFVEKAKWAHLDIAGTAYWGIEGDYVQKGATGSGVMVLLYYLLK